MKMVRFVKLQCALVAAACAGAAASIDVGETTVPLGEDAFATIVQCLNTGEPCGGLISPNSGPPDYQPLGVFNSLRASNILDAVFVDVDENDTIGLIFPVPIYNNPGEDLYLAQAFFLGNGLGFGSADINGFMLSADDGATWYHVPPSAFVPDSIETAVPFWYFDDGPAKAEAYDLWYARVDLGLLGVAAGNATSVLWISAADVGVQPDEKLDIVTIANLNVPLCPADLNGDGVLDLADVGLFVNGFVTHDPVADLAEPFGVFDLADIHAFISAFIAGCP